MREERKYSAMKSACMVVTQKTSARTRPGACVSRLSRMCCARESIDTVAARRSFVYWRQGIFSYSVGSPMPK